MASPTPTTTAVPGRAHLTSLMYSLPIRRLKEVLGHVLPGLTLGPVEEVRSTQLSRLYNLTMSDARKLLLSFAPNLTVRLLRHEATLIYSEAVLIYFIHGSSRDLEASGSSIAPKPPSSRSPELQKPYSILEPTRGAPFSTLSIYLSLSERHIIDKQVGTMTRRLAELTSPSGTFGPASRVLPDPFTQRPCQAPVIQGSKTWSEAFALLFESILRDGEDMNVLLPYDIVRAHFQRLSWRLDAVTFPRLVMLDSGNETNMMIERGDEVIASSDSADTVRLTGLRSWSQGIFGDPLISNSFENPSAGFREGWEDEGEDIIEDLENGPVRLLLYRCYNAIIGIVTEHYRPQADSSKRELESRRKLTTVLTELEDIDVAVNTALKRVRSLSKENKDSKRLKI